MTRDQANRLLCAIITTLDDIKEPAPESSLYLGIGANLDDWQTIKTILVSGGLAISENYAMTLTDAGRTMAAKINAAMGMRSR